MDGLAIEQRLHTGALPIERDATDDGAGERSIISVHGNADGDHHGRRLGVDAACRLRQCAARTELLHRLPVKGQQDGFVGLGQALGRRVGIDQADDRRGRNGNGARTSVDQGDGHTVEEGSGHRVLRKVKSPPQGWAGRDGWAVAEFTEAVKWPPDRQLAKPAAHHLPAPGRLPHQWRCEWLPWF